MQNGIACRPARILPPRPLGGSAVTRLPAPAPRPPRAPAALAQLRGKARAGGRDSSLAPKLTEMFSKGKREREKRKEKKSKRDAPRLPHPRVRATEAKLATESEETQRIGWRKIQRGWGRGSG
jgi:hypothetical protein